MGDKATDVQQMFTAIAGKYDLLNSLLSFGRDSGWRRFAVSKCSLRPGAMALDVATGTGEMARLLAQRYSESKVVGVDCVTIGFALRNVTDIAGACREMARVVKPGGRVVSLELTRPSSRVVRTAFYFYVFRIAPRIGGLISGKREAYTYLPKSILEFPPPEELKRIMEQAGLEKVETCRLTLGAATVHVGTKRG
jgi:demethylmenaquinone methyltransferase/2-methoxy-6-polyprenyl-1,4-benzoquinol methylase